MVQVISSERSTCRRAGIGTVNGEIRPGSGGGIRVIPGGPLAVAHEVVAVAKILAGGGVVGGNDLA